MKLTSYLNFNDSKNYQSIYSSQLYGSFFIVYAKFKIKDSEDSKLHLLENISLKIVNYKGLIEIKINRAQLKYNAETKGAVLKLELRAMNGEIDYNDIEVPKNCLFNKGGSSYFHVDRRLAPMHDGGVPFNGKVFDDELFYREGVEDINEDSSKLIFQVEPKKRDPQPEDFEGDGKEASEGSPMCPKSINEIL